MSVSGANNVSNAQHAQRMHEQTRALENADKSEQVAAGILNSQNSISLTYDEVPHAANTEPPISIAAPSGDGVNNLALYDTNELSALLAGTQSQVSETQNKNAEENIKANSEQTQSKRDQNIENLKNELNGTNNEQDDKCATAKIVCGALLGPVVGLPLLIDGIENKQKIDRITGQNVEQMQQIMANHYGEAGASELQEFTESYGMLQTIGLEYDKDKLLEKLKGMQDKGHITPELHADLSTMVNNGEPAAAVHDRILHDAAATHVDQQMARESTASATGAAANAGTQSMDEMASSNQEFMKFLATQAQVAEDQEETLRKVQEDLDSGVATILSGHQNGQNQKSSQSQFI